jgi:hypothetical protein
VIARARNLSYSKPISRRLSVLLMRTRRTACGMMRMESSVTLLLRGERQILLEIPPPIWYKQIQWSVWFWFDILCATLFYQKPRLPVLCRRAPGHHSMSRLGKEEEYV